LTSSTARTLPAPRPSRPRPVPKYFLKERASSKGWRGPPTSSTIRSSSASNIHRAPQAVAQKIEADRDNEDHGAGQGGNHGVQIDRGPQGVQHQPPFRLRRLGAEAEERQSGGEDHAHADQAGRVDEN